MDSTDPTPAPTPPPQEPHPVETQLLAFDQAIAALRADPAASDAESQRKLGELLKNKADLLTQIGVQFGNAENFQTALTLCGEALTILQKLPLADHETRNTLASAWTRRGVALLAINSPRSLEEAIRHFDEAIALRGELPIAENPRYRYSLAAGWMNRAEALTRIGGAENLGNAIHSYDEAITLLANDETDAQMLDRLAIAWLNRGIALEVSGDHAGAAQSYEKTVALLRRAEFANDERLRFTLACALNNLGNSFLIASPTTAGERARRAAKEALSILHPQENQFLPAGDTALKARHVLCRAVAALIANGAKMDDLLEEATDAVEESLAISQHWEKVGITHLRPVVDGLFRFGALFYQMYQPQFLSEYLLENLDGETIPWNREWFGIAQQTINEARKNLLAHSFATLATPDGERLAQALQDLRAAEERLHAAYAKLPQPA